MGLWDKKTATTFEMVAILRLKKRIVNRLI